jgi:hypothetical protein
MKWKIEMDCFVFQISIRLPNINILQRCSTKIEDNILKNKKSF